MSYAKFDKMFVDYLKWQQQRTINSFFKSIYISWEICMLVKTLERIFILYKWQNIWCVFSWHTSLLWQRGDVQFLMFMNMWHLDNTMVFLFPKCDIEEVGLYYQHYNTNNVFINYIIRCSSFLIKWIFWDQQWQQRTTYAYCAHHQRTFVAYKFPDSFAYSHFPSFVMTQRKSIQMAISRVSHTQHLVLRSSM